MTNNDLTPSNYNAQFVDEDPSFDPDYGWLDEYAAEAEEAEEHEDAVLADQAEYEAGAYWSEVEQGMYDDDPNPYHGDYSEW